MDSLEEVARAVRECADCPLHRGRTHAVLRRGQPVGGVDVHRRGARLPRRPSGASIRRPGRAAPGGVAGVHRHQPRGCFHRQHGEVPPAGQPRPGTGGNRRLRKVPGTPDRAGQSEADCHPGPLLARPFLPRRERHPAPAAICVTRMAGTSSRCSIRRRPCAVPNCERRWWMIFAP